MLKRILGLFLVLASWSLGQITMLPPYGVAGSGTEYQYRDSGVLGAGLLWHCPNDTVGFGGCTASFPALKRSGTRVEVRLADGSGLAELRAKNIFAGAANLLGFAGSTALYAPSDGSLRLTNAAGTDFGLLQFGGTLADDSADALFKASVFNASTGFQVNGAATSGNFLRGNGTYFVSSAIQAGDLQDLNYTWTGTHDFSGATLEVPNSTSLPGTCAVGEVYVDSDASAGQRLYLCESADTWVLQTQSVYNVKAFGAVGDGTTDDTAAINAAETAAPTGACVYFPSGTYKITSTVTVIRQRACWVGDGPYQSVIMGNFDTADILVFGNGSDELRGVHVSGLRVDSSVNRTAGTAIHAKKVCRSSFDNLIIAGQDGTSNLWDGIWFDRSDAVRFHDFEIDVQNDGLLVNGTAGTGPKAGLFVSNGKILNFTNGVVVGGAFGGLYLDFLDIIGGTNGLVIDQSLVAEQNREIFLGPNTTIDSCTGVGIKVDEAMNNGTLLLTGTWLGSNGIGLQFTSDAGSVVTTIAGGTIFNSTGDGIDISSANPKVVVMGTSIRNNGGWGIDNNAGATLFAIPYFLSNTSGDINGNQEDLDARAVKVTSATPTVKLYETDAGSDEKYWRLYSNGGAFYIQTSNDAYTASNNALIIDRSGNSATNFVVTTASSNGNAMAVNSSGLKIYDMGTKPACNSTTRGYIWRDEGGAGVADTLEVCAKNSSDTYAWYPLASIP